MGNETATNSQTQKKGELLGMNRTIAAQTPSSNPQPLG